MSSELSKMDDRTKNVLISTGVGFGALSLLTLGGVFAGVIGALGGMIWSIAYGLFWLGLIGGVSFVSGQLLMYGGNKLGVVSDDYLCLPRSDDTKRIGDLD